MPDRRRVAAVDRRPAYLTFLTVMGGNSFSGALVSVSVLDFASHCALG